jgi:hypothetical protein
VVGSQKEDCVVIKEVDAVDLSNIHAQITVLEGN